MRYVGWYPNRARGERAKAASCEGASARPTPSAEPQSQFVARVKATWARLIRKVYAADPLQCPKCKGPMRVMALIDDPQVIRRILEHLGCWVPEASGPAPPQARVAAERAHPADLSPGSRHRVARCEGQARPRLAPTPFLRRCTTMRSASARGRRLRAGPCRAQNARMRRVLGPCATGRAEDPRGKTRRARD